MDLVPKFVKVHRWSLWFAFCNAFSPQLFSKVHGWSLWFALDLLKTLDLLARD
ncbi:hypothetical protein Hanom_Chr01g00075791 [Helianthus anomalus]